MRLCLCLLGLFLAGGAVMLVTPAFGTTMIPLDLPAMSTRAEAVVAGRVEETHAAWTSDHEAIYTDVTIVVDRVLAGPLAVGQHVVVRREGGSVDGIAMKVYGAASFAKGEDVVVFLERRGASRYVVGMAQGKLALLTDAMGVRHLGRDLSEVAYTRPTNAAERAVGKIATLDELAAEIARINARTQKKPAQ